MATQLQEQDAPAVDMAALADPQSEARDYEAEARQLGWTPKDEFRGDESRWIDAEAFIKRGEEQMPLLKKQVQDQKGKIEFLERQVKRLTKAEQTAYDSAVADIKARQREAVEYGDVKAFETLDKELDTLRDRAADAPAAEEDPNLAFAEFREAHEWYDLGAQAGATETERRARALADRLADKYSAQGLQREPGMTPAKFFAKIAEDVREQIPMLGGERAPKPKPAVDVAGVTRPGGGRTAKTGANLPPEAKAQALRFFEKGIIKAKDKGEALDKFAKDYDWG